MHPNLLWQNCPCHPEGLTPDGFLGHIQGKDPNRRYRLSTSRYIAYDVNTYPDGIEELIHGVD